MRKIEKEKRGRVGWREGGRKKERKKSEKYQLLSQVIEINFRLLKVRMCKFAWNKFTR